MKLKDLDTVKKLNEELTGVRAILAAFDPTNRHRPYNAKTAASISVVWLDRDGDQVGSALTTPLAEPELRAYLKKREADIVNALFELGVAE